MIFLYFSLFLIFLFDFSLFFSILHWHFLMQFIFLLFTGHKKIPNPQELWDNTNSWWYLILGSQMLIEILSYQRLRPRSRLLVLQSLEQIIQASDNSHTAYTVHRQDTISSIHSIARVETGSISRTRSISKQASGDLCSPVSMNNR